MSVSKQYYVYIMASATGTLYTGVTNNLELRVAQHKQGTGGRFTRKYGVTKLVYFEATTDVKTALEREKQVKGWLRSRKVALVESVNPDWRDLVEGWWVQGGDSSLRSE